MIQIYSPILTRRLEYTLHVIFNLILKTNYVWIDDFAKAKKTLPLINYSEEDIPETLTITPHPLLFEEDIHSIDIQVEQEYFFFKTTSKSDCLYDIFASVFYMITRYEEYLSSVRDEHGRFPAKESLAYQHQFLDKAVVERWALALQEKIQNRWPLYKFPTRAYRYLSSIDVDSAFAFRSKGFVRLWGGLIKAILRKDKDDINLRIAYIFKNRKDPFDTFDFILQEFKKHKTENVFFFLIGKNATFDKNISIKKKSFRTLIKRLFQYSAIGLHPSYQSNNNFYLLQQEKSDLTNVINTVVEKSRQHFLKIDLPKTYQKLVKAGIKEDYSMGFASHYGFRAGIASPYPFFDLSENRELNLIVYPFQIMDGTLNQYLSLSPEESVLAIKKIVDEVRYVKGTFISLWHNESLSEMREWKGWKSVFVTLLKTAKE